VGEAAIPHNLPNKLIEKNAGLKKSYDFLECQMLLVNLVGHLVAKICSDQSWTSTVMFL